MDFKQIQTLIKEFEKSSMTVLEIESEGFKIKLSKNKGEVVTRVDEVTVKEDKKVEEDVKGYEVKSPLVGTYYAQNSPKDKPFVSVGQRVEAGDTLCIIEAMKIMNEITAPVSGVIESIKVTNASPVGFDQVLMVIV
ncbi:MAG: biotin/lipoyl-containing protein [Bacilli bacterium]|nr:acetyl-CoA carboxylase, biotin carboxyl carrier protein [Bacilli bacterium]